MSTSDRAPVRVGIIGAGQVSGYHHAPALRLDPRAELVAVCDADEDLLARRKNEWDVKLAGTDPEAIIADDRVDAVVIATPNFVHCSAAVAAAARGKHVLCEKTLGVSQDEAADMYRAARDAGVVHMTAFTYRFAPSMRYLHHLVTSGKLGEPRHFRSQRFLDWPETSWGWRQYIKTAGAGDLYDMTIHRIDFAQSLLGPIRSVCGSVARFAERSTTKSGERCPPSEVDDWSAIIGEFACGATGVWEGTTLAKGYAHDGFGHEWAEINGAEGSAVYRLHEPNVLLRGAPGGDLAPEPVPAEFLKPADSPRDPSQGEPATVFRYDIMWEFISAIVEKRDAVPCFHDGLSAQMIADAVLQSKAERRWVDIELPAR